MAYRGYFLVRRDLRGDAVPGSHPTCVRTILDEYFVRGDPCPIFASLDPDGIGILDQLRFRLDIRSDGNALGADFGAFLSGFRDGMHHTFSEGREMKEDGDSSSVWSKYVEAKRTAFGPSSSDGDGPNTIEELEAAIAEAAASSGLPETGMPPRSEVHPANRSQLSRWFYLVLVILFTSLVVGLLWWGQSRDTA